MHCGYITKLQNIRNHPNADRLYLAECFGNTVIVGKNEDVYSIGIYFPIDLQLSEKFCEINNLCRKKDENGKNIGGFLDPDKRNITALKLRGEKSDGLWLPIKCLSEFCSIDKLKENDKISVLNGEIICQKYIPKSNKNKRDYNKNNNKHNKPKKNKTTIDYPVFKFHKDTEQLAYNIDQFKEGDICYITLKMHGTSQITSRTLKQKNKTNVLSKLFKIKSKPIVSWDYVCSSRRVVLDNYNGGYYGNNEFRKQHHEKFIDKLHKGETVYYEVVGYINENTPIMPSAGNKKTNDKEFIKKYGDTTVFNYGCQTGESDLYVYRMTITNEDGYVVEYPWELVKQRCEEIGVKHVPEFEKFIYTNKEDLMKRVEKYYDGEDPIGKTHIREGIVVKIDNSPTFKAYKHKNFSFKVLSGIAVAELENSENENISNDILQEM